jgi:hypothetical protein
MVKYAPEIIEQFADRLYRRARSMVLKFAFAGGLVTYFGIYLVGFLAHREVPTEAALAGALLAAVPAGWFGWEKGFRLRVEAQRALVEVKIEENTRR